jgi:ComF family protein
VKEGSTCRNANYFYRCNLIRKRISFPKFSVSKICNWLAPALCPICFGFQQDPSSIACNDCTTSIQPNVAGCSICNDYIESGSICGRCISSPPHFDCLIAPWLYKSPLDTLIGKAKFQQNYALASRLGHAAANYFLANYSDNLPQALVPVPLHISRLRERGYNQATLIAAAISKVSGIPILGNVVRKEHATVPQRELRFKERLTSLNQAFSAHKLPNIEHLAIIDDVATSGATLNTIAKALKHSGYQRIDGWCIARSKNNEIKLGDYATMV